MGAWNVVATLRVCDILWAAPFDQLAEEDIVEVINHIHGLLAGDIEFMSADNPNKCKACRFKGHCDRALLVNYSV